MSTDIDSLSDSSGGDHANLTLMRIALTLVFGGIIMVLFRAIAHDRSNGRRRRGPVLTVEEAVRWRPE